MAPLAQHLRIRRLDGRIIAATPRERRIVANVVLRQAREYDLIAFGVADTHLHIEVACSFIASMQLARRVEIALARALALDVGFRKAESKDIEDGYHLFYAFKYILSQTNRHGLDWDPLYEASNLPDLLGMRVIGTYTAATVRRMLPRIRREHLLGYMELPELQAADGPVERLPEAAAVATGLLDLTGRSEMVLEARRAVMQIVGKRLGTPALAKMLGIGARSVYRLRARPVNDRIVMATRLQLGLMHMRGKQALYDMEMPFIEVPE